MTTENYIVYLLLVITITLTPGPAILFIMSNSMLHGLKKTFYIASANILGLFFLGILAVSGLGIIIHTSEFVFDIIKYFGAIYLIYLGVKLIKQQNTGFNNPNEYENHKIIKTKKLFFQAFTVAISNPKAIVFLTALLPQFIDTKEPLMFQFSILIFTLMFFSFVFLMMFAVVANRAKKWLNNPKRTAIVYKTSGGLFIGFGVLLGVSSYE